MEIMGIPLCSANPAMLRHCWSQNLGLVETWGIRSGDLSSRFMFKGPKVSSSSVCPAPIFLRSSFFYFSIFPRAYRHVFWEQFITDDRAPLGFLFHGRLPCRMMQHSRVSLWWVLLHFVAASPAMRLGMVRPKGLFEAFETYPHCLTAGATFSHVQSISITPNRYIEQATVLFYQGKHDRLSKAGLEIET